MWTDTLNTCTSGSPRIQVEPRGSHMEPWGLRAWTGGVGQARMSPNYCLLWHWSLSCGTSENGRCLRSSASDWRIRHSGAGLSSW